MPPVEGVFCDGQIFDAYVFASKLVRSAKKCIVLIDNYVDESVLLLFDKRKKNVSAPPAFIDPTMHNTLFIHYLSKIF